MHHFARNECLPQHADISLLLKVLHKAEVLLVYVVALPELGGWTETQPTPPVLLVPLGWAMLRSHQELRAARCHLPGGSLSLQGDSIVTPQA